MSYDVHVQSKACESCGHSDEHFWQNYTSNVHRIWEKVLGVPLASLDGADADYARQLLRAGVDFYTASQGLRLECRSLEPSNGWGNAAGAIDFLRAIQKACEENPQAVVRICR